MAAPDDKVHFKLSTGNGTITVPHIIAAGGDVQLLVADEHWLHVVSGGLPSTALAVGGQEFSLRELDVAMFQMVKLDVAVLGRTIRSVASSLGAAAEKLQECLGEGMAWTVLGSKESYRMLGCLGTSMCKAPPSAVAVGHGTYDGIASTYGGRCAAKCSVH